MREEIITFINEELGMRDEEVYLGTDEHGFYKKTRLGCARYVGLYMQTAILEYRHGSLAEALRVLVSRPNSNALSMRSLRPTTCNSTNCR